MTSAPPPTRMAVGGHGKTQEIEFTCPEPQNGERVGQGHDANDPVIYGCPIRVYDANHALGSAAIAVHHEDHREVVFSSLHADASPYGPFDHARTGGLGVHTAFGSDDQGLRFADQPPTPAQEPSGNVFGSDADVVLDAEGNTYLAYLYHEPSGDELWTSIIGLFKAGRPSEFDVRASYDHPQWIFGRAPGNMVERVHLMHLPSHTPVRPVNATTNESIDPSDPGEFGEIAYVTDPANATDDRILVTWHETAQDAVASGTNLSGWVDLAWTAPGGENNWTRLPTDQLIGPCSESSEPIRWAAKIYVACVVDKGYDHRSRARIGDVDLWEVDVHENETRLVAYTGMTARDRVMLAQAMQEENSYIGLVAWHRVHDDQGNPVRLEIEAGYGWLSNLMNGGGRLDAMATDMGIQLREWGKGNDDVGLRDAGVTAFEMTDDTYQSLIVYREWHETPEGAPDPEPGPGFPPEPSLEDNVFTPVRNRLGDYNKFLLVFNGCDGVVAGYQAQLGTAVDQFNMDEYRTYEGVFNEPRDGLFKTREPASQEELIYFAMGDYGAVQYGAARINAVSSVCTPLPAIPIPPAVAAPQALTAASGVSMAMAAGFAVPATAMIAYALTVKRRNPAALAAEDEP